MTLQTKTVLLIFVLNNLEEAFLKFTGFERDFDAKLLYFIDFFCQ